MRPCYLFFAAPLVLVFAATASAAEPSPKAIEFFEKKVRPILVNRCYDCHTGESDDTDYRLDSRAAMIKGGLRGPSIIPGKPESSFLMRALRHQERLKMPPKEKLPQAEIAAIAAWIKMGAPWPGSDKNTVDGSKKKERKKSLNELRDFWSLKPLGNVAVPKVKNSQWVQTTVDRFVLYELEKRGIQPSPRVNRRTLLRRVSYDLIGLPPSPDEVRDFLLDKSPHAFAKVVDRLLGSPRYGERWGRHWLDVARYADSNGLDENLSYANAYHYRDYVIAAMNKDKPFNQFVREQIAGDLMPGKDPAETLERQIATGFLALGAKMLAEDDPMKMRMDIIDEQIDTLGRAFLGLTFGCARCHDHKFDPILTTDYYALAGIFKSTKTMENFRVVARWFERPAMDPQAARRIAEANRKIKSLGKQIAEKSAAFDVSLQRSLLDQADVYLLAGSVFAQRDSRLKSITSRLTKKQTVAGVLVREAEKYNRGNQFIDTKGYGKGIGIIASAKNGNNFAEYDILVPAAGVYEIALRYAAAESRPIDVSVNGATVKASAIAAATGSWYPDTQRWSIEGRVLLKKGKNVVRFYRRNVFPHIDKVALIPQSLLGGGAVAARQILHPEIVKRWSRILAGSRNDPASIFAAWHALAGQQASSPKVANPVAARLLAEAQQEARVRLATKYRRLFQQVRRPSTTLSKADVASLRKILNDKNGPFALPKDRRPYYGAKDQAVLAALESQQQKLAQSMPKNKQMAMGVTEGKPADIPVHIRGSHLTLGATVPRDIPVVFRPRTKRSQWNKAKVSGRKLLADWMASDANPLTSRVIVNRLWRWHFGKGIVASTDNFGRLGQRPSHTGLLNWLAAELIRHDWSLKALHRTIVMSATYQMDSRFRPEANKKDPENKWLWRYQPRRLEAEAIRDGILFAAGQLDFRMGGTLLRAKNRAYVTTSGTTITDEYKHPRRSIYLPVVRSGLFEMFSTFDFADPTASNGNRSTTTIAPQALFLMNSEFIDNQSMSLAKRVLAGGEQSDGSRMVRLYRLALNRPPADEEVNEGLIYLSSFRELLSATQKDRKILEQSAWKSLSRVIFSTSEFVFTR